MPRTTVIFIDGEYLRKIYKNSGLAPDIPVLIRKILKKLGIEERELLRVYYYSSPPYCSSTPTPKEKERYKKWQRFINFLERQNSLEIKLGRVEKRYWDGNIGYEQKMVDVLLSIDLVQLSAKSLIDTAILVAGDSDFVPAVQQAKNNGVKIYLFCSSKRHEYHQHLWKIADQRVFIDETFMKETCLGKR